MNKLFLTAAVLLCLCACTVDIDWEYNGYVEIVNETSQTLTISVSRPEVAMRLLRVNVSDPRDGVVKAGQSFKLYLWDPPTESLMIGMFPATVTITFSDGSEIKCSSDSYDYLSSQFFSTFEYKHSAVWSHFQKHEIIIESYVIDQKLIDIATQTPVYY